jgi:hypothetical protein
MTIYDKEGKPRTVTNLDAAIEQADLFRGLSHADKTHSASDKERQDYWEDIYQKLLALQKDNPPG